MGRAAVERQRSVRLVGFDWRGVTVATDTPTAQRILAASVRGARGRGVSATAGAEHREGECSASTFIYFLLH
jgi:hypothetical protein